MRILMLHNHYQQPGGEDRCFAAESSLLERHGHAVERFVLHNDSVGDLGMAAVAARTVWSRDAHRAIRERIRAFRPDILHAHNTFPLISPAAFHAARDEGVPTVMTIHNFRLLCVNAQFFRDGRPCEDCSGRTIPWPGVRHRCYRGSALLSGGVAAMIGAHNLLGTWRRKVDVLIALTGFVRDRLVAGGIPPGRIRVKPNFLDTDPGLGSGTREGPVLFVGRLSPEKGVGTLVEGWRRVEGPQRRLRIVGDGPLAPEVRRLAAEDPRVEWLGWQPPERVAALLREAAAVIVPSECYETFGLVIIEAFAAGTPVLASRLGAMAELVEDGRTGALFRAGDPAELARRLEAMLDDAPAYTAMRAAARAAFEARYTAAENHRALMAIYAAAGAAQAPQEAVLATARA
jgi:glycosyltransferase involved in cell wall biosynthesis